jgi:hypothetical protein
MFNPLKIKESDLLKIHNQVVNCFIENQIPFRANYEVDPDPTKNSTIIYSIELNGLNYAGLITANEGRFGGIVYKNGRLGYLEKEGFCGDDIVNNCEMYVVAPCVMAFVCMIAYPVINELVFSDELTEEFERMTDNV